MLCSAASRWRSPCAAHSASAARVSSSARLELAARAVGQREVVERGDPRARVAGRLRELEAAAEVLERVGRGAAAGGERAEQVVGLAERARVAGLLGQRAGALGELGRARRVAAVVRAEREVGGDPRALRRARSRAARQRGLEVRGRERPLAAPVADLPEPVLDRADAVRRRVRRGRLVGGQRGAVLALQRLQVADRGVQRGRLRIPDRQRRPQVLERLGVGEQRPRVLGGAAVGGGRLGVAPREPEVAGDLSGAVGDQQPAAQQRVRHAPVQEPPPGEAGLVRHQPPQLLVREVVVVAALAHEPAARRAPRAPSTVSSSPRPDAARTVSTSNERPMTAAAASTWRAVSLTGSRRASSSSRAPAGSVQSGSAPSELRYSTSRNGSPSVSS